MDTFDLIVIGSGPAGQKAAIAAAKLGRRAAVIDRGHMMGGVCINTGTIPSKTQRELYGEAYRVKDDITIGDVAARIAHVVDREVDVVRNQLTRNHVSVLPGTARFIDSHSVRVEAADGTSRVIRGEKIVIAVGTKPARSGSVDFDGRTIVDSDQILNISQVPASMVVVGAGVIGIEYASMFAA